MDQGDAVIPLACAIDDFDDDIIIILVNRLRSARITVSSPFLFFIVFAFDMLVSASTSVSRGCRGTSPTACQVQGDYS